MDVKAYFYTFPGNMANDISRHLPNFLTCLNLFSGCMALVFVFKGDIPVFSLFVGASILFDFLDGFAARTLNAYSPIGKDMDSLADMVTFGVVPGAILYHLFLISPPFSLLGEGQGWQQYLAYFPFIVTVFSALRLAKFNVDSRQSVSFLGLPTPAVTIFVTGLALNLEYDRFHITPYLLNSFVIAGISMILSFLLVSEIPLFAMKFRSFDWSRNKPQYLMLMISIALLLVLRFAAIPLLIVFYLILSLINNRFGLSREKSILNESK
jgi:CDP-diacylglycerol--serine O-phosphatidyltransferase